MIAHENAFAPFLSIVHFTSFKKLSKALDLVRAIRCGSNYFINRILFHQVLLCKGPSLIQRVLAILLLKFYPKVCKIPDRMRLPFGFHSVPFLITISLHSVNPFVTSFTPVIYSLICTCQVISNTFQFSLWKLLDPLI